MKNELSVIDLHFLIKELKVLEGSIVDKIFQFDKEVYFRLHSSRLGKKILVITKNLLFIAEKKKDTLTIHGFCAFLRKKISRAKLVSVEQLPGERIVKVSWDHKEPFSMYIELFNKGNIVLCNARDMIVGVLSKQIWDDRRVLPKEEYTFTKKKDILSLSQKDFVDYFKDSKDNISKTVASSLGRIYTEELCKRAKIDISSKVSSSSLQKIHKALQSLLKQKVHPMIYYAKGEVKDITPFSFEIYESLENKSIATLSEGYDEQFKKTIPEKTRELTKSLSKIDKKISAQEATLKKQEKSMNDNNKKGEMIYENYQLIKDILDTIATAKKKYSYKEIAEKLKDHKIIKKVDTKTGMLEVEL